jgi:hypothetical protein
MKYRIAADINNVLNVIIIQKANTKSSVGQHGPPTNAKQDQVPRRSKHSLLTGHTRREPYLHIR